MTTSKDDLELKNLWQDSPAPDVEELLASVRKSRTRMWQLVVAEAVVSIVVFLMIAILALRGFLDGFLFETAVLVTIAVVLQAWMWRWRQGLWQALSNSPIDLLKLQRKRTLVNLKIARYYAWGTPISILLGVSFVFLSPDKTSSAELPLSFAFGVLIVVGLMSLLSCIYGFVMIGRCKREIKKMDARIAEFEDDEK